MLFGDAMKHLLFISSHFITFHITSDSNHHHHSYWEIIIIFFFINLTKLHIHQTPIARSLSKFYQIQNRLLEQCTMNPNLEQTSNSSHSTGEPHHKKRYLFQSTDRAISIICHSLSNQPLELLLDSKDSITKPDNSNSSIYTSRPSAQPQKSLHFF